MNCGLVIYFYIKAMRWNFFSLILKKTCYITTWTYWHLGLNEKYHGCISIKNGAYTSVNPCEKGLAGHFAACYNCLAV